MSSVTIYQDDGTETTVTNPEFVDTLCNTREVAVDGRVFDNVTQVQYNE